jgi:hypothetical protein
MRRYHTSREPAQILIAARIHQLRRLAEKTSAVLENSARIMSRRRKRQRSFWSTSTSATTVIYAIALRAPILRATATRPQGRTARPIWILQQRLFSPNSAREAAIVYPPRG